MPRHGFPKFKGMPGRKGDNWRRRRLATIILDKTTRFIHPHRRLNNETLTPVNFWDSIKTYGLENWIPLHPIQMINENLEPQSSGPAC